jgi:hypothetical protein
MQVLELEGLGLLNVAHGLHWVLLFIPFYSVAKGLYDLGTIYSLQNVCLEKTSSLDLACKNNPMCCGKTTIYSSWVLNIYSPSRT